MLYYIQALTIVDKKIISNHGSNPEIKPSG